MKKLTPTSRTRDCQTGCLYKGRPLVIRPTTLGVLVREQRRPSTEVFVPWDVVYEVGWKIKARENR